MDAIGGYYLEGHTAGQGVGVALPNQLGYLTSSKG